MKAGLAPGNVIDVLIYPLLQGHYHWGIVSLSFCLLPLLGRLSAVASSIIKGKGGKVDVVDLFMQSPLMPMR